MNNVNNFNKKKKTPFHAKSNGHSLQKLNATILKKNNNNSVQIYYYQKKELVLAIMEWHKMAVMQKTMLQT